MQKDIDLDEVWELVQASIYQRGRRVFTIGTWVDSPAGSMAWTVYEWEKVWWVVGGEGEWYGPFEPSMDEFVGAEMMRISADAPTDISGPFAKRVLPYLAMFEPAPDQGKDWEVLVNGVTYRARQGGEALIWKRAK